MFSCSSQEFRNPCEPFPTLPTFADVADVQDSSDNPTKGTRHVEKVLTRATNGKSGAAKGLADPLMHLWRIHVVRESGLVFKRFVEN